MVHSKRKKQEGKKREAKGMERWVPLLQIFLDSPTPEGDASLWLHQHHHHHSPSDFLSLLESPTSSPPLLYIQTLPSTTQSRILSFLAIDSHRFCPRRLHSLATHILSPSAQDHSLFWARRAAHHLLDSIPSSPKEEHQPQEEEFDALPDWLQADATLLPQLHLRPVRIPKPVPPAPPAMQPEPMEEEEASSSPILPLSSQDCNRASALRIELLSSNSTSQALHLSREIVHLCLGSGPANQLQLLSLIEPWQCDDETISLLLSNLVTGSWSEDWPAHVLCSTVLPKLLLLQEPASRTLLSAVIGFCKLHQREAMGALVLPLLLRKGGIGVHLCDVLARIVKECIHPAHVSAFCQRHLCCEGESVGLICQPCHRELIANKVEWTESLFTLFQHMLNHGVQLTPDSVDRLVLVVDEMVGKFSKSLKFGNFFLCFVSKCFQASCFHKVSLIRVAERTDSFVTKSILAKLADY